MQLSFLQQDQPDVVDATIGLALRDQALTRRIKWLFRDSLHLLEQTAGGILLRQGEQQKWRPVLRDAHGNIVHSPGYVLLDPIATDKRVTATQPVVQLVLPQLGLKRLVDKPIVYLQHKSAAGHLQTAQHLFNEYVDVKTKKNTASVRDAIAQYTLLNATINPARPQDLRRGIEVIVSLLSDEHDKRTDDLTHKLLRLHPLYRVTVHPDIGAIGRQRIEQTDVPLSYKGVPLQPRQIQNLLLGNTIEVMGIRDPQRGSLYRAGVSFNILHGKVEETSRREQLKTDNKREAMLHQRSVHKQDTDGLRTTEKPDTQQNENQSTHERTQRPL